MIKLVGNLRLHWLAIHDYIGEQLMITGALFPFNLFLGYVYLSPILTLFAPPHWYVIITFIKVIIIIISHLLLLLIANSGAMCPPWHICQSIKGKHLPSPGQTSSHHHHPSAISMSTSPGPHLGSLINALSFWSTGARFLFLFSL